MSQITNRARRWVSYLGLCLCLLSITPVRAIDPGDEIRTRVLPADALRGDRAGTTFAILGDRTAGREWGLRYLQRSVAELNRLSPELVLSVGDLVQGYTRSEMEYQQELTAICRELDKLEMPWLAAVGNHDVIPGSRDPKDHRFEKLYQQRFGALYYSVDFRDLHFIVLYSDERLTSQPMLSDAQLKWLQADLDKTFENQKIGHVFVLVHKPVWRYEKANWAKVHQMLVEFNRRPVVDIEGLAGGVRKAPKVEAVFAGHWHSYLKEPAKDGIGYYALSVTGGQIDQDKTTGQIQSYMLVKVDAKGTHLALVEPFAVHGDDYVLSADQTELDKIVKFDETTMGIAGALDQPVGGPQGNVSEGTAPLQLHLKNPLSSPLEVQIRMASRKNLVTDLDRENANPFTDSYDSPWSIVTRLDDVTLAPGKEVTLPFRMFCPAQNAEILPPQMELVVKWEDSKGRKVPTVLKRRIPLVPRMAVGEVVGNPTPQDWAQAPVARTYAQVASPYDFPVPGSEFKMLTSGDRVFLRVTVPDDEPCYFDDLKEPWNLACDAVSVDFAPRADTAPAQIKRLVVLPFASGDKTPGSFQPRLLANSGLGKNQTALEPWDQKQYPVTAEVHVSLHQYVLDLTLPQALVFGGSRSTGRMNVLVTSNDDSAHSNNRAWARDDLGPKVWGLVEIGHK